MTMRKVSLVGLSGEADVQSAQSGTTLANVVGTEPESDVPPVLHERRLPRRQISLVNFSMENELATIKRKS